MSGVLQTKHGARQDAENSPSLASSALSGRHYQLSLIPWPKVAILDFSGEPRKRDAPPTLETCLEPFLADLGHLERLRPHTLRAYRYELVAAAADPRFQRALSELIAQGQRAETLPR